jgi:hypothetical protein
MATLDELGAFLQSAGLAVEGTDMFLGSQPDTPDRILSLHEYPGGPPQYTQDSFMPKWERVQIQVVARARTYQDAKNFADRVWQHMAVVTNAILSGTHYLCIRPNGSPAIMRRDMHDRLLIFFNATIEKEVTVAAIS